MHTISANRSGLHLSVTMLMVGAACVLSAAEETPAAPVDLAPRPLTLARPAETPAVQLLVPDIEVREIPAGLTNLTNIVYAPDGRLFAAGYDGRMHLLVDRDGDGLEESVTTFVEHTSDNFTLGMAFSRGALYELRSHQLIKHEDRDGDGVPESSSVAAEGWDDQVLDHDPLYTHRRVDDALGLAIAADGTIYVSKGAANFSNAYLLDKQQVAHLDLKKSRGCVLRIKPGGKPEIFATGVRFLVSMQINRAGDLFATDQEGATWLPNGNPFDELLHLQEGRHYGFPPRHPRHLPDVIDEPSVFDYAPQHQSTCGFRFNEPSAGAKAFGPPGWDGDAIVTGESRGKLFRTKLVRTAAGYVARSEVVACFDTLPIDVAISPTGELVVACHGGRPDWGNGPRGKGKLYKLAYVDHGAPQAAAVYALSPTETRIEFDRVVTAQRWHDFAAQLNVDAGRYASAGDDIEAFRPGYRAVDDQQAQPRVRLPIASATLNPDGRSATIVTGARAVDMRFVVTAHPEDSARSMKGAAALRPGAVVQQPLVEMSFDLGGVAASWSPVNGAPAWTGWLPHPDLEAARGFTAGSAPHARLWELAAAPGTLRLRGQLDLAQMLRPAVQPGATLDHQLPAETVTVSFRSQGTLALVSEAAGAAVRIDEHESRLVVHDPQRWVPFALTLTTGPGIGMEVAWSTAEDPRPRTLPLRRVRMPWAVPAEAGAPPTSIPEIAGGDREAGKALFHAAVPGCARCHTVRGEGDSIAPDLSNLVARDYASVLRDIQQPSATINPDYPLYAIELADGRIVQGVIVSADADALRVGGITGLIETIARKEVVATHALATSLMPEGLLAPLSAQQVRDLMTFLLTPPPAAKPGGAPAPSR